MNLNLNLRDILFGLMPGVEFVFRYGRELTKGDFLELTAGQYEVYYQKEGPTKERIFRLALAEPTVTERTPEKVTLTLEIVTEQQKRQVLAAVDYIRKSTKALDSKKPSFQQRLEFLGNSIRAEVAVTGIKVRKRG